jgi:4-hydroxybutyryl-CoA dehydratase/vinylacetyl-CoA-Delta-isomerase
MMMTGAQYKASLADGRRVYIDGERVENPGAHADLAIPFAQAAEGYDRFYAPGPEAVNPYLMPPETVESLREHGARHVDSLLHTTFTCAMSFLTAGEKIAERRPQGREAVRAYVDHVRMNDLRMTECITDAKGDRSLPPGKQADPDAYLRVVSRQADGIVIRGAKLHVSLACIGHELAVMPTKAMKPGEEDYAVACAVPANAEGVKMVSVGDGPAGDLRDAPFAARRHTPQCFVIFDDVFVPNERVFLDGEIEHAASFAHSLGLWLRASTLATMADDADMLVGLAQLMAEANGLEKVAHVREKITDMVMHAGMIRAALEASIATGAVQADGSILPNELYTNLGKYIGAGENSLMLRHLVDIAGGSALTVPSTRDLENPEVGPLLQKYMAGKADGAYRARLFHAIRDLTASAQAGRAMVGKLHGSGGLYAQRIVTRGRYDMDRAKHLALGAIGLSNDGEGGR